MSLFGRLSSKDKKLAQFRTCVTCKEKKSCARQAECICEVCQTHKYWVDNAKGKFEISGLTVGYTDASGKRHQVPIGSDALEGFDW